MKGFYVVSVLISLKGTHALHALKDGFLLPRDTDLQFSHMGKVFNHDDNQATTSDASTMTEPESTPESHPTEADGHAEVSDGIKGGSERLMDNVPVSDLKRGDDVPVANTTNNAENSTTTNSSSTHSDNNSKTDQSQTHHNVVKHGNSNYRGDTSTNVTNNFYNPAAPGDAVNAYSKEAKLELQYLWKRINVIDDKLDKLMPLVRGDPHLDPNNRKGLVITFDAQSDPDNPTVDLE
ncbi:hypothetical protein BBOV_II003960 [Babesia bovis T2Bo]|uniref:Membrane protein, putative n=1 Tax=Babesia bovis TaxID=5865 RepID=A7ATU0_BABBO|nr:hypothetical protein BBOV_II003960 [Babesia bovis T2Bo]EDO06351.1 hypothetical protein BBOV_II003960 [Babesia bovis T2Bo]|eukprot:XP_001609919.1 membrane protein [Babesia bovis T2Bo]